MWPGVVIEGGEERILQECPVAENVSASPTSPRPTLVVTRSFGGHLSYVTTASVCLCLRAFSGHWNLGFSEGKLEVSGAHPLRSNPRSRGDGN